MTTYIVEVPDGGDYRKVEVEADSAWNDSYGLTFEREKKAVAMFRDWICFYRKESDAGSINVTINGNPAWDPKTVLDAIGADVKRAYEQRRKGV